MKKSLVYLWHILSILILIATIGLAVIVFIKPNILLSLITYVGNATEYLWWKNYMILGWLTFVESIPFLNMAIPGQTLVIIIAWFVAQANYFGTAMVVVILSIIGDWVAYWLGAHKWSALLLQYWPTFGLTETNLNKIRGVIKKLWPRAVFVSKRNSYTRGVLPFLVGIGHTRANIWEFMLYNTLGSLVYGFVLVWLAKLFVGNTQHVVPYIRWIWVALLVGVWVWYFFIHRRNEHKNR